MTLSLCFSGKADNWERRLKGKSMAGRGVWLSTVRPIAVILAQAAQCT